MEAGLYSYASKKNKYILHGIITKAIFLSKEILYSICYKFLANNLNQPYYFIHLYNNSLIETLYKS